MRNVRSLECELPAIALLGRPIDPLEDQLADAQARPQDHRQRAGVPDLQLDRIADETWVQLLGPKAGVDCGSRDVNAQTQASRFATISTM